MPAAELAAVNMEAERSHLDKGHWDQLVGLVEGAKKSMVSGADKVGTQIALGDRMIKSLAPKNKKGHVVLSPDEMSAAHNELRAWVVNQQKQSKDGTPPTDTEVTRQATLLMLPVEERWAVGWSDSGGLAADVRTRFDSLAASDKEDMFVPFDKIPAQIKQMVQEAIVSRGLTVSDALVEDLSGAWAIGDTARARRLLGVK